MSERGGYSFFSCALLTIPQDVSELFNHPNLLPLQTHSSGWQ